jgi:pSer/pThr/pTyr-binding forkhead associated (FHA) protein
MRAASSGRPLLSAPELKAQIEAERAGIPFLVYRDEGESQQILVLTQLVDQLWIGRSESSSLPLAWDSEISTVHAELERSGDSWILVDDGLSRNGTYVNGERLHGRRVLSDRDAILVGRTVLTYRAPGRGVAKTTVVASDVHEALQLSSGQRRVLIALCRPFKDSPAFAKPATNKQIAAELVLSIDAVKTHLRTLFQKFGLDELPQNSKRLALVEHAFASGLISVHEL